MVGVCGQLFDEDFPWLHRVVEVSVSSMDVDGKVGVACSRRSDDDDAVCYLGFTSLLGSGCDVCDVYHVA